ncbi:transforming growth factor beta activator LRRC32 isoform X2 [Lampris incognitus]|uniref:transforming growth factor beta activator LRRC32 isoform X2 n=1 Tax=Lampris incognitus TaxID=2546036 RepID=UPI0024B51AE0|nr:transforming growth factor beta activator LRRC32 isoform X2 [Lampris incognitus]XP_056140983.1 transforming growth factor beta activator LRRC32 isoform X2 [Lampris incognitus]
MAGFHLLLSVLVSYVAAALRPPRQLPPCQIVQNDVFCNDLNLQSTPANLPPGIQKLDLSHNKLQNLTHETLAFHTTIHHLNLHSNKIQFIQPGLFKDMTNLKVLILSRNNLDVFALNKTKIGSLKAVESLDLSNNGLYTGMTDYFLGDSPAMTNLSLNGNSITKITKNAFCGSLALRKISLHNNVILEIEDGAFDLLDYLTELDLSKNSITCITDFNLSHLKWLNLSKNSLETFQTIDSEHLYELLYLDLSENKMPYFPVLPKRNKLEYLDVSRNHLRSVNNTGTVEELANFRGTILAHTPFRLITRYQDFSSLIYLDLSYNQIKSIPQTFICSMVMLEVLNVSRNCIESFFVNHEDILQNLKILDLSYNSLQNLSFGEKTLQSLKELFLQGNTLTTINPQTFQRLPGLRSLQLQQNNLKICIPQQIPVELPKKDHFYQDSPSCVFFYSIPALQFLYLSENNLRVLPANAFHNTPLKLLDLSLNPGLEIDPNSLSGLEHSLIHLLLKENNISQLNTDLSALSRLKYVDLSTNQLTTLPIWNKESSIESLNLQNNNLVTLEYNTVLVLERSLKTIYMGSNPLSCCSNIRFLHMVQRSAVVVPDIDTVTCVYVQDSEPVNIEKVTQDMCHTLDSRVITIIVTVVIALVLIVVLGLLSKLCHPRRRKHNSSFSA